MAVTYTWKVTGLKVRDEGVHKNAVVQTYWEKIGTDEDGNEGKFSGATPFSAADVPEGSFVPFGELTEETVLSWIQSVVVGHYEQHVNGQIQKQIDSLANPIKDQPLPWAPAPEPVTPSETTSTANTDSTLTPEE